MNINLQVKNRLIDLRKKPYRVRWFNTKQILVTSSLKSSVDFAAFTTQTIKEVLSNLAVHSLNLGLKKHSLNSIQVLEAENTTLSDVVENLGQIDGSILSGDERLFERKRPALVHICSTSQASDSSFRLGNHGLGSFELGVVVIFVNPVTKVACEIIDRPIGTYHRQNLARLVEHELMHLLGVDYHHDIDLNHAFGEGVDCCIMQSSRDPDKHIQICSHCQEFVIRFLRKQRGSVGDWLKFLM